MLKNIFYILIAVIIDLFQIGVTVAFGFIGAFTGTLGGAAGGLVAGGKLCADFPGTILTTCTAAGAAIGGIIGSFLDPALAPFATPVATFIGLVVNSAISISIGTGFILLLIANGFASWKNLGTIVPFYIAKVIPISDVAPCWTVMVIRLSIQKNLTNVLDVKKVATDTVVGAAKGIETGPEGMLAGATAQVTRGATKRLVNDGINTKNNSSSQPLSSNPTTNLKDFSSKRSGLGSPLSQEPPKERAA